MADRREQILARLFVIIGAVPGIKKALRNEIGLKPEEQPGVVLLDGDEELVVPSVRRPNQFLPQQIMKMRFQLYLQVKDMRPRNHDAGTVLNGFRILLMKALSQDVELRTLIGTNGALEYAGAITDLKAGAAQGGEMQLEFTCNYLFNPNS